MLPTQTAFPHPVEGFSLTLQLPAWLGQQQKLGTQALPAGHSSVLPRELLHSCCLSTENMSLL